MKKLFAALIMVLMVAGIAQAAGSSGSCDAGAFLGPQRNGRILYTCTFVGDDASGAIPDTTVTLDGFLIKIVTDPSATLTDNYDIVMNDQYSADMMGGALANRDTTNTEVAYALTGTTVIYPYVYGTHTFVFTNNSDTSSAMTMYIYVHQSRPLTP